MGDAAMHLDFFEQSGRNGFFSSLLVEEVEGDLERDVACRHLLR